MDKIKDIKKERFEEIVSKFQKYGVGLIMTGYIATDAENQTLWHELVYPNRVTGKQIFNLKRIENKYFNLYKKAKEVEDLADAIDDDTSGPHIAFTVIDAFDNEVNITYEELALFAFAAYRERKDSESYVKRLAKAKAAKDSIDKNLSAKERRKKDQEVLDEFEKEFGKDVLDK